MNWEYIKADFQAEFKRKQFEAAWKAGKRGALLTNIAGLSGVIPSMSEAQEVPHPLHAQKLQYLKDNISKFPPSAFRAIAIGDSLRDIPRDKFTEIKPIANFGESGALHYHCKDQLVDTYSIIPVGVVQFVYIGTCIGNPLMAYQDYEYSLGKTLEVYESARALYPLARIIGLALPPTESVWANLHRPLFEAALWAWCVKDGNAVMESFQKLGTGFLGLFPKMCFSADTVHASPEGVARLNTADRNAQTAPRGSVVFV